MRTFKIEFSKLIGHSYPLEIKMAVLDWMLKTGKGHVHSYGWTSDGINKSLYGYSANNHDFVCPLPSISQMNFFFDAVFARAIYGPENIPLKTWRANERIFPGKHRMLKFNDGMPAHWHGFLSWWVWELHRLNGKFLKKEGHHPDRQNRTEPKILNVEVYTIGNGWIVQYQFSFKEFDYEPGWRQGFRQQEDESVWQFIKRSHDELKASVDVELYANRLFSISSEVVSYQSIDKVFKG